MILIVLESGESLITQYTTQIIYYSKPELLVKRFIVPFTPFGLLPIIFYKELINFFKSQNYLFMLYKILLLFFGDPERLMKPMAPVYCLFIATLIKQYVYSTVNKVFSDKIIIILISTSFLASFYHLWGTIVLPGELYSMISTVFFTIFISAFFFI